MNALDREVGEIVARHLHEQDPRFVWTVVDAPTPRAGAAEAAEAATEDVGPVETI